MCVCVGGGTLSAASAQWGKVVDNPLFTIGHGPTRFHPLTVGPTDRAVTGLSDQPASGRRSDLNSPASRDGIIAPMLSIAGPVENDIAIPFLSTDSHCSV